MSHSRCLRLVLAGLSALAGLGSTAAVHAEGESGPVLRYPPDFCCPAGAERSWLPDDRIAHLGRQEIRRTLTRRLAELGKESGTQLTAAVLVIRVSDFALVIPSASNGFAPAGAYRSRLGLTVHYRPGGGAVAEEWNIVSSHQHEYETGLQSWIVTRASRAARSAFRDAAEEMADRLLQD